MSWKAVWRTACPLCGAQPGQACDSAATGKPSHKAREVADKEAFHPGRPRMGAEVMQQLPGPRVQPATKAAFLALCAEQGVSPSEKLRKFVEQAVAKQGKQ